MSGTASSLPDDELVVLAGEYVLGTLDRDEARLLAREAETDGRLADAITAWEQQFAPMMGAVVPVQPPVTLWPRIEASLAGVAGADAGTVTSIGAGSARGRLAFWRGTTAVGFLLAACVAGFAFIGRPVSQAPVPVAALAPVGAQQAVFVAEAQSDGSMLLVPLSPVTVASGHDLELWSLPAGAKVPKSLGVLPPGGIRLAAAAFPAGPGQLLVSLEPKGGSPTGLPTGPVLYGGALTRAE